MGDVVTLFLSGGALALALISLLVAAMPVHELLRRSHRFGGRFGRAQSYGCRYCKSEGAVCRRCRRCDECADWHPCDGGKADG